MARLTLVTSVEWLFHCHQNHKIYWYGNKWDKKKGKLTQVVVRELTKKLARVEFLADYNGQFGKVKVGSLKWVKKSRLRLPR